jgi:hypothetical protein
LGPRGALVPVALALEVCGALQRPVRVFGEVRYAFGVVWAGFDSQTPGDKPELFSFLP